MRPSARPRATARCTSTAACELPSPSSPANRPLVVRLWSAARRRGRDIVRALALGARAVFVGRPVFWGLALGGQRGVERMIEMFETEMTTCMQLCGAERVADIGPAAVHDRGSSAHPALTVTLAAKEREIALLKDEVAALRESQRLALEALAKL